jgi:hypothetical protein
MLHLPEALWGGESMQWAERLQVQVPVSVDESVEGPLQERLGIPGSSRRPLHLKSGGKKYTFNTQALQRYLPILSDFLNNANDKIF